jgi:hypothetical protein
LSKLKVSANALSPTNTRNKTADVFDFRPIKVPQHNRRGRGTESKETFTANIANSERAITTDNDPMGIISERATSQTYSDRIRSKE